METLGGRVQALRTEKGMGLRALARETGISPSFMVGIEDGSRTPSPEVLERIAAVLDEPLAGLRVLDPRLPVVGRDALRMAWAGEREALLGCLGGLEDDFLVRLGEAGRVLADAAGEVLERRHS